MGSNIFNLLAILGTANVFGEIPVKIRLLTFDPWIMAAALPFSSLVLRMAVACVPGLIAQRGGRPLQRLA